MPELKISAGPVLGQATDHGVRIWVALNPPEGGGDEMTLDVRLSLKEDFSVDAPVREHRITVHRNDDWTGAAELGGLEPDTRYYYRLFNGAQPLIESGLSSEVPIEAFNAQKDIKAVPPPPSFTTFPHAAQPVRRTFFFFFGGDLQPFRLEKERIFQRLNTFITSEPLNRFMVWTGSQVPASGHPDLLCPLGCPRAARDEAEFLSVYRAAWGRDAALFFTGVVGRLPNYLALGPGELGGDDVDPGAGGRKKERFDAALKRYRQYQEAATGLADGERRHYHFSFGADVGFFVPDLFTRRGKEDGFPWLGQAQHEGLCRWLADDKIAVKFVVSPLPLIAYEGMKRAERRASWEAVEDERGKILDFIAREVKRPVHFLCGGAGFSGLTALEPEGKNAAAVYQYLAGPTGAAPRQRPFEEWRPVAPAGWKAQPGFLGFRENAGQIRVYWNAAASEYSVQFISVDSTGSLTHRELKPHSIGRG